MALSVARMSTACAKASLQPRQARYVAFTQKPLLKFDRFWRETYLAYAPGGFTVVLDGQPLAQLKTLICQERSREAGERFRSGTRVFFFSST